MSGWTPWLVPPEFQQERHTKRGSCQRVSNKLLILHYSEDPSVYDEFEATASIESLCEVLESMGFEVVGSFADETMWSVEFDRADLGRPFELAFLVKPVALTARYVSDPKYYAALCWWIRGQVPDHLPVHVWGDGGLPFFEVDFDNLEEQISAEIPM